MKAASTRAHTDRTLLTAPRFGDSLTYIALLGILVSAVARFVSLLDPLSSAATSIMASDADYLIRVRESCIALNTDEARVDRDAAKRFADSLDIEKIKTLGSNLSNLHEHDVVGSNTFFSVTFPTPESEVNMIAVAHALDFGYVE